MPGNGFAFPVRVSRQKQPAAALHGIGDGLHALGRLIIGNIGHGEIIIRQDRTILGRQVAHVAVAGQHNVIVAQILIDGFGLGRGFDDHNIHFAGTHFI